jgi:hypothetical protein
MSIEIINEQAPPPRPTGRTSGKLHLVFVKEETGEILGEVESDPMMENERRLRDEARILDVGHKSK